MHASYKTLFKGRSNPDEILQKLSLPLDEQPNEQQTALVKQCLAKLDENIPLDEAVKQAMEWAASQSAIATKERPMPALAVQDTAIAGIPPEMHGDLFDLADKVKEERTKEKALAVAKAPFDGINDALDQMDPETIYNWYKDASFFEMKGHLDSPEILSMAKEWAKGKKP